jgi:predicted nucleic acid-binding protein
MPLVTTTLVVVELANFLSHPRTRGVFATFLARFRADRRATIVSITDAFLDQAIALYAARPDKEWSLTDCASFVVMQHRGLTDALTADHHFDQADFVALLK